MIEYGKWRETIVKKYNAISSVDLEQKDDFKVLEIETRPFDGMDAQIKEHHYWDKSLFEKFEEIADEKLEFVISLSRTIQSVIFNGKFSKAENDYLLDEVYFVHKKEKNREHHYGISLSIAERENHWQLTLLPDFLTWRFADTSHFEISEVKESLDKIINLIKEIYDGKRGKPLVDMIMTSA